ncbi:M20 family metallopeptidase [Ornithinibacillus massiliensis]|uniref:Peptidase M20 domain-containing protein 2 n=1 Tax=Ornithinibacillus massiliensis TaxID=1944633 RepID=A0ABS5MIE5_9BACI|nr:M20 family metallopeptidase [Ornithinibacillus massiliensis]MBS3681498.1 M20 family metallopeptidase [Ornithinibacillus massiliensis]
MKQLLKDELQGIEQDLWDICKQMYDHPELGDQEYESMKLLTSLLEKHSFSIETGIVGRPTAFKAEYTSGKPGPKIAYLAEYDALPGVGHGCGHNLIGTMSVGAGITLSKVIQEIGGSVVVLGTPAEETNGAKVPMSEQGVFDDMDVAMILHPSDQSYVSGESLAMDAIQFAYSGKASHAAASPEKGINALDSVIQLFNGINALREHLPTDVRIHGVITEGGKAANVVPDYAVAQFYIRAKARSYLNEVVEKVKNIATGAALMAGTTLEISNYELSYDDMITNQSLSDAFTKNLAQTSDLPILAAKQSYGSIDMGNVSQVVPAIHPYIGLNKPGLVAHTKQFAEQTITEDGYKTLKSGALALAGTGFDIITNKDLLESIKSEFETR